MYSLLGIKLTPGSIPELNQEISRLLARDDPALSSAPTSTASIFCLRLPWLADFYNQADIVYVDGAGIVFGARLLGCASPQGPPWMTGAGRPPKHLARHGHSLYLLGNPTRGGRQGRRPPPGARPWSAGPGQPSRLFESRPGKRRGGGEINSLAPDVLMVGLGMPMEQQWIMENHARLRVPGDLGGGVGVSVVGRAIPHCPRWLGNLGLNWLFRLLLEPRRLAGRYLWGNLAFLAQILKARYRQRPYEPHVMFPRP